MPSDAAAVKRAHARRLAVLARQAESLAKDAEQNGPFEDGTTAEDFRAQVVELNRHREIATLVASVESLHRRGFRPQTVRPWHNGRTRARRTRSHIHRSSSASRRGPPSRSGDDDPPN
jgi:hypothetical protein